MIYHTDQEMDRATMREKYTLTSSVRENYQQP